MPIIEVHLRQHNGTLETVVHLDQDEMITLPDVACSTFANLAMQLLPDSNFKRLTYLDDEGDACTLTPESVRDALTFCEAQNEDFKVLRFDIHADTPEAAPAAVVAKDAPAAEHVPVPEVHDFGFSTSEVCTSGKQFYIGEATEETVPCSEEKEATMHAAALALLLQHGDENVRNATYQALQEAAGGCNALEAEKQVPQPAAEEPIVAAPVCSPPSAIVIGAELALGDVSAMAEEADARGDATAEFASLVAAHPGVKQAFRLGRVAVYGDRASAVVKAYVKNDGAVAWPESCALRIAAGPAHGFPEMPLGSVAPGDAVELVLDLNMAHLARGTGAQSAWAICDESGQPFGPVLVLEVVSL